MVGCIVYILGSPLLLLFSPRRLNYSYLTLVTPKQECENQTWYSTRYEGDQPDDSEYPYINFFNSHKKENTSLKKKTHGELMEHWDLSQDPRLRNIINDPWGFMHAA